jgi:hypothetical protein
MREIRYAFRTLSRNPGFSLTAMLVLALGIGANPAIFTFVRAVLLAPLPYRDPDRLGGVGDSTGDFQAVPFMDLCDVGWPRSNI